MAFDVKNFVRGSFEETMSPISRSTTSEYNAVYSQKPDARTPKGPPPLRSRPATQDSSHKDKEKDKERDKDKAKKTPRWKSFGRNNSGNDRAKGPTEHGFRMSIQNMAFVDEPYMPRPFDPQGSNWADALKKYNQQSKQSHPSPESTPKMHKRQQSVGTQKISSPTLIYGTFSGLKLGNNSTELVPRKESSGTDSSSNSSGTSLPSSAGTTDTMKRREPKSPVYAIGTLEHIDSPSKLSFESVVRRPSAEQTVDAELKILDEDGEGGLDDESIFLASPSVPRLSESHFFGLHPPPGAARVPRKASAASAVSDTAVKHARRTSGSTQSRTNSPESDNEALVSFSDDAIYFKPVSFSPPETPSDKEQLTSDNAGSTDLATLPAVTYAPPCIQPPSQTAPDAACLQIGLDLLTQQLTTLFAEKSERGGQHQLPASHQVWIMIEAYQSLNERMKNTKMEDADRSKMNTMLNSWLSTLHTVHNTLNKDTDSKPA